MADPNQTLEVLKLLDHKQEQILQELDDLNQRIESILAAYQATRSTQQGNESDAPSANRSAEFPMGTPRKKAA